MSQKCTTEYISHFHEVSAKIESNINMIYLFKMPMQNKWTYYMYVHAHVGTTGFIVKWANDIAEVL